MAIETHVVYQPKHGGKIHRNPTCASNVVQDTDPLELYANNIDLSGVDMTRLGECDPDLDELCNNCWSSTLRERATLYIQENNTGE